MSNFSQVVTGELKLRFVRRTLKFLHCGSGIAQSLCGSIPEATMLASCGGGVGLAACSGVCGSDFAQIVHMRCKVDRQNRRGFATKQHGQGPGKFAKELNLADE